MNYQSIDLYSGCGGLTLGLIKAGFKNLYAIENDKDANNAYKLNHPKVKVFEKDIRQINPIELEHRTFHLLAGCPPCQGFSSLRRLNRKRSVLDKRNDLLMEYLRFVKELKPYTIMMENVPWLINYYLFKDFIKELEKAGYKSIDYKIVNVRDYGVPQNRKRLVLVGSRLGQINVAEGNNKSKTVRQAIGYLPKPEDSNDELLKINCKHTPKIQKMISLIPQNGGSRKDLPKEYLLECHKKKNVGFNDVYGRMKWDDFSPTITGGCLNPSKGRFLHPEQNRVISPREAALLQSFPKDYKFPTNISKTSLSLMIGNSLPPKFSYIQSLNIKNHLDKYFV